MESWPSEYQPVGGLSSFGVQSLDVGRVSGGFRPDPRERRCDHLPHRLAAGGNVGGSVPYVLLLLRFKTGTTSIR